MRTPEQDALEHAPPVEQGCPDRDRTEHVPSRVGQVSAAVAPTLGQGFPDVDRQHFAAGHVDLDRAEHDPSLAEQASDPPSRDDSIGDTSKFPVSATALAKAIQGFDVLARYHRLDVRGLERIPEGAAVLVGNHNGGLNPVDGLFLIPYYQKFGFRDPVYILAHDLLFRVPRIAEVVRSVGIVPARRGTARDLLDDGRKLLVFPGGDIENMRPFRHRRKIVLAGRTGFLRQAIRTGAPIIPVVGAGNHETLLVLSQGRRLAKRLKLDRLLRIHSLPILLAAPWGILVGPTCALPYLPLPSKVTVEVGHPIDPGRRDLTGGSERRLSVLYRHVELTMQQMLDALYEERRYPVVG